MANRDGRCGVVVVGGDGRCGNNFNFLKHYF